MACFYLKAENKLGKVTQFNEAGEHFLLKILIYRGGGAVLYKKCVFFYVCKFKIFFNLISVRQVKEKCEQRKAAVSVCGIRS